MTHTTNHKIDDAKSHLGAAKDDIKSAAQSKTAEKLEQVGDKVKAGMDHLAEKVAHEDKNKH